MLWRIVRYFRRRGGRYSALPARKHWALLLAHPYVEATGFSGFDDADTSHLNDTSRKFLRAQMLHQMELRTDATDDDARAHLARVLETQWFRADLHALRPTDDPRAALAFACARMAFLARVAMLMGWTEPDTAWRVLLLNAQRARTVSTAGRISATRTSRAAGSGWRDFAPIRSARRSTTRRCRLARTGWRCMGAGGVAGAGGVRSRAVRATALMP